LSASAPAPLDQSLGLREQLNAAAVQLTDRSARAEYLAAHSELSRPEVVVALSDLIPKLIRTDTHKAWTLADLAHLIARELNDAESLALALRAKANLFHISGKNKAAVRCHDRARVLFAKSGNRIQMARTLSASIQPLILLGEYERAYAVAQEASAIFKEDGNEWRLARVELNTGNILDRQDRFSEALEYYLRAYRNLWSHREQDPDGVAVALHNMAGCYVCLNDFHLACRTYEEARAFASQHGLHALVAQADYNIATLHYLRGEYSRAIALLRGAREACEASGDRYHYALCLLNLSEIYLEMNMGSEAEEAGDIAHGEFHRLGTNYEAGKSAANIAIALSQQGKHTEAHVHFEQARGLFQKEKNQTWTSLLDLYQAISFYQHERNEASKALAMSALGFFRTSVYTSKAVLCHLLLARLAVRIQDMRSASRHCARALVFLRSIESPLLSCQANTVMAQVMHSMGDDSRALQRFRLAEEFLEQLRSGIHNDELRISFMRDRVEIYEGLVELSLAKSNQDASEIVGYIEKAKARSLLDLVNSPRRTDASPFGTQTPTECRIRELRQELNWYQHRVEIEQLRQRQESGQQQLAHLRAEARKRERELLRILRENTDQASNESASGHDDRPFCLEQIQSALHPDATIVEYFRVKDRLIAALITQNRVELAPVGSMPDCHDLLTRLRFQIAKPRLGMEYVRSVESVLLKAVNDCLSALYTQLVAPIRDRLITSHIVFVPHGALHHLPFHALFDGSRYLLEEFTVSYAPSAAIYTLCDNRKANPSGPALIIGVPDAGIPVVEAEARAVAQILPAANLVIGPDATLSLLAEKGSQSRFLHIATHGYFREDQPMFSGIRLSDCRLSTSDLYRLKLPVELATLSGCSTGMNVVFGGDEILGLARGLICAGVQSALLSLWDVHDQSTGDFMRRFYERMINAPHKAQAVRDSALELRKSLPHPYYWAPFVLMGKNFRN
jgi:CHAT domain-containing protein